MSYISDTVMLPNIYQILSWIFIKLGIMVWPTLCDLKLTVYHCDIFHYLVTLRHIPNSFTWI